MITSLSKFKYLIARDNKGLTSADLISILALIVVLLTLAVLMIKNYR
jgi:hypothetical protein